MAFLTHRRCGYKPVRGGGVTLDSKDMSASINWPARYAAKECSYALGPHTSDATVQETIR